MKIFNQPATYVLVTLIGLILLAYHFDFIPNGLVQISFALALLLVLFYILNGVYSWILLDLVPAWRRRRAARQKGGQDRA